MASSSTSGSGSSSAPRVNNVVPFSATLIPLALKLDRNNFFIWRSQVLSAIRAHDLEGFLTGS